MKKEFWSWLEESNPPSNWRDSEEYLNIGHIVEVTQANGPGKRFGIWVQGCSICCKGCWNRELWSFRANHIVRVDRLVEYVLQYSEVIEGITISGGEPLDQARALKNLVEMLRKKSHLTVMLYTGYYKDQIPDEWGRRLFQMVDIVVSGPYIQEERDLFLLWRGSKNQKLIFHNARYRKQYEEQGENVVEIHIDEKEIKVLGFPEDSILEVLKR